MKRFLSIIVVLIATFSMLYAAKGSSSFVPSIEAKTAPAIAEMDIFTQIPEGTKINTEAECDIDASFIYDLNKTQDTNTEEGRWYVLANDIVEYASTYVVGDGDDEAVGFEPIIYITDDFGDEADIVGAVLRKYVTIVPYAERTLLEENPEIDFINTYEDLRTSGNLADLIPLLLEYYTQSQIDKMSITQIFYLAPKPEIVEYIDEHEELNLRLAFPINLKENEVPPTICAKDAATGAWTVYTPDKIERDWPEEGIIAVDFHYFGTIIFLENRV